MKWISVKKCSRPPEGETVILYSSSIGVAVGGKNGGSMTCLGQWPYDYYQAIDDVTHWMPLPGKPEKVKPINWISKQGSGWPPEHEIVILYSENKGVAVGNRNLTDLTCLGEYPHCYIQAIKDITHWMPLPKKPEYNHNSLYTNFKFEECGDPDREPKIFLAYDSSSGENLGSIEWDDPLQQYVYLTDDFQSRLKGESLLEIADFVGKLTGEKSNNASHAKGK